MTGNLTTTKVLLGILFLVGGLSARAQDDKGSDKVDLKKLEEKYWGAKDADYNVVQNRAYPKAARPYLSLSYGPLMNDLYSTGRMTNLAVGYFMSERYGFEFSYEKGNLVDNDGVTKYRDQFGVQVDYNQFVASKDLSFIFVPLYAKMSFLDRAIFYFDMQIAAGIGSTDYVIRRDIGDEAKSGINFHLDVSQQIFFHQNFAFRLDVKNKWYKQERQKFKPDAQGSRVLSDIQNQDTSILLGITYFH